MVRERNGIGLDEIEVSARRIDRTNIDQRHRSLVAPGADRQVLEGILERKFEAQVADGIAIVVDIDLVDGVLIEIEKIRTARRVFQRNIVGYESDIGAAPGLVAAKPVEIGPIHSRLPRNRRSLTVTGCYGAQWQKCRSQQSGATHGSSFHCNPLRLSG